MANYYVDPAAGGANNGANWTDAWTDIQSAYDTATANDNVYCRGTQTLSSKIDIDTQTGSLTGGFIRLIGCNASGNIDGTRFILDGNSAVASCIEATSSRYSYWHENFEFKNATGIGISQTGVANNNWVFVNCSVHDNGSHGVDNFDFMTWVGSVIYSNGGSGIYRAGTLHMFFSRIRNNTSYGIDQYAAEYNLLLIGCIIDNNGDWGIYRPGGSTVLFNTVVDGNNSGGIYNSISAGYLIKIFGSRITNHDTASEVAVQTNGRSIIEGWNYFQNNDGNNIQGGYNYNIPYDGSVTTAEDQGDTESGYVDEDDPEDYNLTSIATMRRTEITIPVS